MATEYNESYTDILDTLKKYQDRHVQRLSSKKLKEAVIRVMDEKEEEIERNINNITCKFSISVSSYQECTKERFKLVIRKTTCCRRSGQNG